MSADTMTATATPAAPLPAPELADTPGARTRREARREERRQIILDAATRSFMDQGYAGTTMTAIATTLGGSKGTLWSHFPSKDVLFAAVVDRATESFRAQLSQALNPEDELNEALRLFCSRFLARLTSPEGLALYRLVIGETGRTPEIGQIFHARGPQIIQRLLANFLAAAMANGQLRTEDSSDAAQLLMQMCLSGSHHHLLMGRTDMVQPGAMDRDIDRALTLFLRAYLP